MAWTGLGVNYKAAQSNWTSDITYFNSIGLTGIRPNLACLIYPWAAGNSGTVGSYAFWRLCAQTFAQAGFWVTWGPSALCGSDSGGALTATGWSHYHDAVVAEATYLQAQGISLGAFELGNEMESMCDGTTLTVDQFVINMGQLATDVKAVYSLAQISYSAWNFNGTTYDKWISTGLGGLDYLAVHPYSNISSSGRSLFFGGFSDIAKVIKAFGPNHTYVSEWGLEATDDNYQELYPDIALSTTRDRYAFIKNLGFLRAQLYTYIGYLNTDNQFAVKLLDGSFLQIWDPQVQDDKRTANITVPNRVRGIVFNPTVSDSESITESISLSIH